MTSKEEKRRAIFKSILFDCDNMGIKYWAQSSIYWLIVNNCREIFYQVTIALKNYFNSCMKSLYFRSKYYKIGYRDWTKHYCKVKAIEKVFTTITIFKINRLRFTLHSSAFTSQQNLSDFCLVQSVTFSKNGLQLLNNFVW